MKFFSCCSLLALAGAAQAVGGLRRGLATDDDASPDWTYRSTGTPGEEPYGPDDWYLGYPDCAGERQSPINLAAPVVTVVDSTDYPLEFGANRCSSAQLTFQADFAVWQVAFDGCTNAPYLMWNGEQYNLLQLHIHSPSEYTFGGAEHAAGVHFVHIKDGTEGDLLVVGVLFDVTEYGSNIELEKFWSVLGTGSNTTDVAFNTNPYEMLPVSPSFTHFLGSLTTPPCSEGVKWIVMNEPSYMGKRQIEEYRRAVGMYDGSKVSEFGNTNRPIQAINDRDIKYVALEG